MIWGRFSALTLVQPAGQTPAEMRVALRYDEFAVWCVLTTDLRRVRNRRSTTASPADEPKTGYLFR
ncbi:hypothetical protein MGAST_24445 [Mycobacterium gastri 'Wayne']|uniref:Uncharacterized protein n=1 Tax=Mycobacterium gastri TaxID=1777 RepID=A0A1X1V0J6_MYCGS|nr:hypothetical protein MGAST_24445 [Mycobacterium gastri 'Wayne']ORV62521.1 hypothetical protein AWC07_01540 [Mycobacterium gastri]